MADILPFREPLRQQLIRSVAREGGPRLVGETAADRVIRMGAIAARLNEEAKRDPSGEVA